MDLQDGIKKTLLAGVGAAAITVEKSSEVIDKLVKKGELTVEQGKTVNQELKHKAEEEKAKTDKKDFLDMVSSLSDEELAKLKEAISQKEEKKDA